MTLKEMKALANESGYTVDYIFRHGLNSLLSYKESLKADRDNPLKYQIDRIIHNLADIGIAENILREWYGVTFCDIDRAGAYGYEGKLHLASGIDEVAQVLGKEPKETNEWNLEKSFIYNFVEVVQLAERNSTEYVKAFGRPNRHYSTTYEKVYGKGGEYDRGRKES